MVFAEVQGTPATHRNGDSEDIEVFMLDREAVRELLQSGGRSVAQGGVALVTRLVAAGDIRVLVGTQALLNVVNGERYQTIPDEVIRYAVGRFGKPLMPMDAELEDRIPGDLVPVNLRYVYHDLGVVDAEAGSAPNIAVFPQPGLAADMDALDLTDLNDDEKIGLAEALYALRVGAGLVTAGIPESLNPALEVLTLEAMTCPLPDERQGDVDHRPGRHGEEHEGQQHREEPPGAGGVGERRGLPSGPGPGRAVGAHAGRRGRRSGGGRINSPT